MLRLLISIVLNVKQSATSSGKSSQEQRNFEVAMDTIYNLKGPNQQFNAMEYLENKPLVHFSKDILIL